MSGPTLVLWALIAGAAIVSGITISTTWVSSRFAAVTKAQYAHSAANSTLATAYSSLTLARLTGTDEQHALAAIATGEATVEVTEAAVQRAEARLPRGRSRRTYFAEKES